MTPSRPHNPPLAADALLTVGAALRLGTERLRAAGIDSAALDMSLLLAHALGMTRLEVYTNSERPLDTAERSRARELLARRIKREPLSYILGTREFFGLTFKVTAAVLIPRPETEHLIEQTLAFFKDAPPAGPILDLGTGSGAIAIALARQFAQLEITAPIIASDLSEAALAIARENATTHGVTDQIRFRQGDLFSVLHPGERLAAIVSNPPYISERDRPSLAPEVVRHEPAHALFSGPDGLDVIRRILLAAPDHLLKGGLLALECGHDQASLICEMLTKSALWNQIASHADLAGILRTVTARLS